MILVSLKNQVFLFLAIFFLLFVVSGSFIYAQTETPTPTPTSSPDLDKLQKEISELQGKIADLQKQKNTLSSQIAVMDSQMKLTQLRINATQQEIADLTKDIETTTKKISKLETTLDEITKVLLNRIIATYEVGTTQPFHILLSANSVSDFFTRLNYLKIAQTHDKKLIFETQQAKTDYANQKEIFEDKKTKVESLKKQLEDYTAQINREKIVKQKLLEDTQNDEKKYQDLLAKARSEYEAIQGIIAGRGQETEVGNVTEGKVIASVISGQSCNSGGTHLHFIVARDGNTENPFNYLKSGIDYENCSGSSCGSGDGDSFNPSGSWNWPLDPKISLTQGYGSTWATRYTWVSQIYNFHNGLDIQGSSLDVKAVKGGTLYQGSYTGYNGCRLRYVRVHQDDNLDTFYLHINYTF